MSTRWYVCGMDDGVLRQENTRRAAVAWLLEHHLADKVRTRYQYGPGSYGYTVGDDEYVATAFVERGDKMGNGGWDIEQQPLYPLDTPNHHERVERPTKDTEQR